MGKELKMCFLNINVHHLIWKMNVSIVFQNNFLYISTDISSAKYSAQAKLQSFTFAFIKYRNKMIFPLIQKKMYIYFLWIDN